MLSLCVDALAVVPAWAAPVTWIGGSANWDGNTANWSSADEPDFNDEAIFNSPDTVNLANATEIIQALTMSGGAVLSLNGNDMVVELGVELVGADTNLIVGSFGSALTAGGFTIDSGGNIELNGGTLTLSLDVGAGRFDINAGGVLSGFGPIALNDILAAPTNVMINDGQISAQRDTLDVSGAPLAGTLSINAADADVRINLDGLGEAGVVNVFRNQTLDINIVHADAFSGDLTLFHHSTIDMADPWTLDAGTIDVDNGFIDNPLPTPDVPADVSFINGGRLTQSGGTITMADTDGTLQFNASFNQTGGTFVNNGLVVFNNTLILTTIGAGANFSMPLSTSSITVNAGVVVNVDQANFNADDNDQLTNVITVNASGVLDLDLGAGADESLSGPIILNGGKLDVTTADGNWVMDGSLTVGASTGTSQINGHSLTILNHQTTVNANSTLAINTPLGVGAGNQFTGAGTLVTNDTVDFGAAVTFNMSGGTVDIDGTDAVGNTINIRAPVVINAATMSSFGRVNPGGGVNVLVVDHSGGGSGALTVNLDDPNAEWTLNAEGSLFLINAGPTATLLDGNAVNLNGTVNVTGDVSVDANNHIGGIVDIDAGGFLRLSGSSNRLEGGTINGPGTVILDTDDAGLYGSGTINTDIYGAGFTSGTDLRADDGILTINSLIFNFTVIGLLDNDGILNIPGGWNTFIACLQVSMNGGEIRGGTITNGRTITGTGLISAQIINNAIINANANTLVVETAANDNDWDGTTNTGQLSAAQGTLKIIDDASFPFSGSVAALLGEVIVEGFALQFQAGSLLRIWQSTYRSSHDTNIGGQVLVQTPDSPIRPQIISVPGTVTFQSTSSSTLDGDLHLDNTLTVIEVGATFAGNGALINDPGRTLQLLDGVTSGDLAVLIQNEGTLELGASAGQVSAVDYEQAATGVWEVELGGTGLNDFDRMNLTGAAALAGGLNLSLIGVFVPALGQTFNILSATGVVSGTFDSVTQPSGMPVGLFFDVVYSPFLVQLMVIAPVPGDYNQNGTVDAADYVVWRDNEGTTNALPNDPIGGTIGSAQYDQWRAHFGQTAGSPGGAAATPEPPSIVALVAGGIIAITCPGAPPKMSCPFTCSTGGSRA